MAGVLDVEGPVQIISVSEDGSRFTLHAEKLDAVMAQLPPDMPISVVSVVGAFRTGKSFLLDLMLRYLRYYDETPGAVPAPHDLAWLSEVDAPVEGSAALGVRSSSIAPTSSSIQLLRSRSQRGFAADDEDATGGAAAATPASGDAAAATAPVRAAESAAAAAPRPAARSGFGWRGGRERMTTGIWLWSRPFVRRVRDTDAEVAVLLMDTQGLFDSETSQMLTTSIFGLSTLLSSLVLYNLPNQIQEDHLQHLALFAEYGRRAQQERERLRAEAGASETALGRAVSHDRPRAPFQHIRLLVRDSDVESDPSDFEALQREMAEYLNRVLSKNHLEDLASVREQIRACFDRIDCYTLPHPSLAVRKKDYDGNVRVLEKGFLQILNYLFHSVFAEDLHAKRVHDAALTATEFPVYVKQYAGLFQNPRIFPEARMLLDATAEADALAAAQVAYTAFDRAVNDAMGAGFVAEPQMQELVQARITDAFKAYDGRAMFGAASTISKHRAQLEERLQTRAKELRTLNTERNPLKYFDLIVFPLLIAAAAFVLRLVIDWTCSPWSDICKRGGQFFGLVYSCVFAVLLFLAFRSGAGFMKRAQAIYEALQPVVAAAAAQAVAGVVATPAASAPAGGSAR